MYWKTYYKINWDKVETLQDIKNILSNHIRGFDVNDINQEQLKEMEKFLLEEEKPSAGAIMD